MEEDLDSALPEVDRSSLLEAFEVFDEQRRGEGRWENWQSKGNHKYAIEFDGRLYPVKEIVSMATGRPNRSFSGGEQANSFVEGHGFDVVSLEEQPLQEALGEVMSTYLETRQSKSFGKTGEDGEKRRIWRLFEQIEELLEESSVLSQRPHVRVKWSVGQGNWARVPWIAFLDDRETTTTQEGVYAVYLFREDMSGVYVTYNQGVTRPKKQYWRKVAYPLLRNRAERLRRRAPGLSEAGFNLDGSIDLSVDSSGSDLGRAYEVSTVAHRLYQAGEVPGDEQLLSDLDAVLRAYDRHVSSKQEGKKIAVDRSILKTAVDNVIRPAIAERGDLEENGQEGDHHHKLIPEATPNLTPEELDSNPREAVLKALRADADRLLGNQQQSSAKEFLERADPDRIEEEVSNLLYGSGELAERVRRFLEWGSTREIDDGKTAGLDGTVASYLLALSDPKEYAFCKTRVVYSPAAEALLGEDEVRSEWPERVAHARDFYRAALELFQEEHEDLPFFDLMHVHIAFYLAENADEDAPWGEGTIELDARPDERDAYKIAPGHDAEYWDKCKEEGYICVGWGEVGDLRQYENYEAFREAFRDAYYPEKHDSERKITEKSREVWRLAQMEPGDLVVANRGINEVLAVGEVKEQDDGGGAYEWRPDRSDYRHVVHVDWDETYAQEIPPQEYWRFVTVQEISDDLLEHILERKGPSPEGEPSEPLPPPFEKIYESVRGSGMVIDRRTLRRYHVSLRTRGFVILSGVSGTGKTWLTKLYAEALKAKRRLKPVAPNWTTNEDLLGYYNPVEGEYHHTEVSRFLKQAEEAYNKAQKEGRRARPYHLVLDEMNLARVEYYFAKFLSRMEERKREGTAEIDLGDDRKVELTPNLSVIGTVNIDETTHAFADKVYDRAQLIEMEAPRGRLEDYLSGEPFQEVLLEVWDAIGSVAPFAFRVVDEVTEYIDEAQDHGSSWQEALDEQLLQKVLPKMKGTEPAVGEALKEFLEVATEENYPLSHAKAKRMLEDFRAQGFTSYF